MGRGAWWEAQHLPLGVRTTSNGKSIERDGVGTITSYVAVLNRKDQALGWWHGMAGPGHCRNEWRVVMTRQN